jgi:predicted negative regulator of RcsB-dependent stress response
MARQSEHKALKIDRKALKEDAFRDTMFWLVDWVYQRRTWFIAGGTALVIVVAAGLGGYTYWQSQRRAQSEQFYEAERLLSAPNLPENERDARARKAYEAFTATYPSSRLAPVAWLHIAALAWGQNDLDAARKAYQAVLAGNEAAPTQRDLAHIGLAQLDEAKGDLAGATAEYKAVADSPYGELKALSLGRVAEAQHNGEAARQYFEQAARAEPGSPLGEWARQNLDYQP